MTTTKIIATSLVSLALLSGCDDADKSATSSSSAAPATISTAPENDAAVETTSEITVIEATDAATETATEAPADASKAATETKVKEAPVEAIEKVSE